MAGTSKVAPDASLVWRAANLLLGAGPRHRRTDIRELSDHLLADIGLIDGRIAAIRLQRRSSPATWEGWR